MYKYFDRLPPPPATLNVKFIYLWGEGGRDKSQKRTNNLI